MKNRLQILVIVLHCFSTNFTKMKQIKNYIFALAAIALITSCNEDYLNKEPLSELSPSAFFNRGADLELFTNSFYPMFPGTSTYNGDNATDNIIQSGPTSLQAGNRSVPASDGGWSWGYLRDINYFLAHYKQCTDPSAVKHYSGVARWFRAYFYFDKVKQFGDVPWYGKVLEAGDEELYKARDPRAMIVDSILVDLNYAIANLSSTKDVAKVTKWTALALKSRVCLYEGTLRKYHGGTGAEELLALSAAASKELMDNSGYTIYHGSGINSGYHDLFCAHDAIGTEVILARQYSAETGVEHDLNYYLMTSSYGMPSMSKSMINSYLMSNGDRFTDKENYNQIGFPEEAKDRDPRLAQTIRTPGYKREGESEESAPQIAYATTGYHIHKYLTEKAYDNFGRSITDLPLFRLAEVLLNFAEAKAELGTLTQADLDESIQLLRNRVGMPAMKLDEANANPDAFLANQYPNVSGSNKGVILEIRRERRVETYMENFRWDDIIRWKSGLIITQPFRGMYFPQPGEYDLNADGTVDVVLYEDTKPDSNPNATYLKIGVNVTLTNGTSGMIIPHPGANDIHKFDESKDYLFPLPTTELVLNTNLEQNPNWPKL